MESLNEIYIASKQHDEDDMLQKLRYRLVNFILGDSLRKVRTRVIEIIMA